MSKFPARAAGNARTLPGVFRGAVVGLTLLVAMVAAPAAPAQDPRPLATCFWEGPISTERPSTRGFDGRNFNFPEESATYWLARFNLPDAARIELRGQFAYARYQSLNAYSGGAPTDALADFEVVPDQGSSNPFLPGARRDVRNRSYTVTIVNQAPPADAADRSPNTLYAAPGPGEPIEVVYRTYEPDRGRDLTGDTGLPEPELVMGDGSRVSGDDACARVNDPDRSIPVQTTPAEVWRAAVAAPGCDAATNPAYQPVRWERFLTLEYASLAVISDCTQAGFDGRRTNPPQPKGGFYSNRDNAYIYSHLSRRFGPVLVVRGRMPTVPPTYDGEARLARTQLRFWSLCTGESRVTTRTPDCLADRQVPLTRARDFTIVVSRAEDRPSNANAGCGVGWLDWGERGDAAGRPDYGVLILRNMLPAADFAQAIQRVEQPGDEPQVMGPFFPQAEYGDKAAFESRGCAPSRLTLGGRTITARGRTAPVPLSCDAPAGICRGRVRLVPRGTRRTVATGRYALDQGATSPAKLVLRPAAARALRRGPMRVTAIAHGRTSGGVALRARRGYVLRAR